MWRLVLCFALVGCGISFSDDNSSSGGDPEVGDTEAVGWKWISAAAGGVVDIPDGASLEIPPGALERDTMIVVRIPRSPSPIHRVYILEPEGTTFSTPAILHIPYQDNAAGKDPMAIVYAASELNPELSSASEITRWAPLDIAGRDESANLLSVELDHFTFVYATFAVGEGAYLVTDIPFRYLRPADIMVTLTNVDSAPGPSWQPGHVGIVRKVPGGPSAHPIDKMIESVPDKVRDQIARGFITDPEHLYLGPHRPKGSVLNDAERQAVVNYAIAQLGKAYTLTGQGNHGAIQPVGTIDTFSCVGLVEAAYDIIDRGMLNLFREFTVATPIEMFLNSEPVTRIVMDVGETLELPVYGVVIDTGSPYIFNVFRGWYQRDARYSISAANLPEGATFDGSATAGYTLKYTPTVSSACDSMVCASPGKQYDIDIIMDATPKANVMGSVISLDPVHIERKLSIFVMGNSATKNIPATESSLMQHFFSVGVPEGAVLTGSEFIDVATGLAPSATPFSNYTLSSSETCGDTGCTMTVNINKNGPKLGDASIDLRYYVDYEMPYYDGH